MTRFRLLLSSTFIAVAFLGLAVRLSRPAQAASTPASDSRTFEFTYRVHFPATPGAAGPLQLWIPAPARRGDHQTPSADLTILGEVNHATGHDSEYGNEFVVFTPTQEQTTAGFDAAFVFWSPGRNMPSCGTALRFKIPRPAQVLRQY